MNVSEIFGKYQDPFVKEWEVFTGWLDEHSPDFSVINWPPSSPNLNPIEHLWDALEQGVKGHHTAPTNLTELWAALANIWQVISGERFQNLLNLCLVV
ncbi:transposable element Tcb2 transposase [Trichonephila clavipes]|nr:transposable element Tcb2 transposase [Trichonephila clavipes]